jgi:hypothetical protein
MAIGIALAVAAAAGYTVNTLFLALLGRKAGFTTTKYIFLIALAANLLIHLIVFGRPFPGFERIEYNPAGLCHGRSICLCSRSRTQDRGTDEGSPPSGLVENHAGRSFGYRAGGEWDGTAGTELAVRGE